jgi:hypothetical protein
MFAWSGKNGFSILGNDYSDRCKGLFVPITGEGVNVVTV